MKCETTNRHMVPRMVELRRLFAEMNSLFILQSHQTQEASAMNIHISHLPTF